MDYPNLSIVSYNLLWTIKDDDKLKNNVINNIDTTKDYYNPDFFCFQEASYYKKIIKLFDNNYSYHVNFSGDEQMLTIWKKRFELIKYYDGEFDKGRPFCIFILYDTKLFNKFILINLHAGHIKNTYSSIFKILQKKIDEHTHTIKDITRIVLTGDFNRNINKQINSDDNLILYVGDNKFKFFYSNIKEKNSCCSKTGKNLIYNVDHTIDSYAPIILKHYLSDEKWYIYPSSDHTMIISIIKKYI